MLVDRLEALVNGASRFPMTGKVMIDEQEAMDVLDLMRTTIPDEIKQARRVNQDREKILAQAQTEANRIVRQAEERAERLLSEDSLRRSADERAHQIVEQARAEAGEIRDGADQYAMDLLDRLDRELQRIQGSLNHAIEMMHAPRGQVPQEEEV
jgi:vacuolar-type H+-ATPase subunit H